MLAVFKMIEHLDEVNDFYLANAGFEAEPGSFERAREAYFADMRAATNEREIAEAQRKGLDAWRALPQQDVYKRQGEEKRYPGHAVLVAVGRTPNTTGLNLEAAGIELNDRGGIKVDEHLRTTADNVWAMGDVPGGMQFPSIAYDDFRIVASDLLGDGSRTTKNRGAIPYCTFVHPPFARVGMTADEARKAGYSVQVYKLPAEKISQARILQDPVGLMKACLLYTSTCARCKSICCARSPPPMPSPPVTPTC